MSTVDPQRLIEALEAAGWDHAGRGRHHVRLTWPGERHSSLVVPLEPEFADYPDLLGEVLAELEYTAEKGARARQVLDAIGGPS